MRSSVRHWSVFAEARAVGHADAHAHVALFVPAADVVGGALGFEIKIDDVARHCRTLQACARMRQAAGAGCAHFVKMPRAVGREGLLAFRGRPR
jgi:hypothetical protein